MNERPLSTARGLSLSVAIEVPCPNDEDEYGFLVREICEFQNRVYREANEIKERWIVRTADAIRGGTP